MPPDDSTERSTALATCTMSGTASRTTLTRVSSVLEGGHLVSSSTRKTATPGAQRVRCSRDGLVNAGMTFAPRGLGPRDLQLEIEKAPRFLLAFLFMHRSASSALLDRSERGGGRGGAEGPPDTHTHTRQTETVRLYSLSLASCRCLSACSNNGCALSVYMRVYLSTCV